MIEPTEKQQRETRQGTPYEIWKWVCPQCNKERSTLYLDGEWCHGDGQVASSSPGLESPGWRERCSECWASEIEQGNPQPQELPITPSAGLLMSMALRYDHGLGCPGYYDMLGEGQHKIRLEAALALMRQLYEEVSGQGFYSPASEQRYAEMVEASTQGPTPASAGINKERSVTSENIEEGEGLGSEIRENGPWKVDEWDGGRLVLQSQDFHHDAALEVSGDFGSPELKKAYADEICRRLNAMNPDVLNAKVSVACTAATGLPGYSGDNNGE